VSNQPALARGVVIGARPHHLADPADGSHDSLDGDVAAHRTAAEDRYSRPASCTCWPPTKWSSASEIKIFAEAEVVEQQVRAVAATA